MNQVMPLAMVSPGEVVEMVDVKAGWGLGRKLADMGLTSGVVIRVMNRQVPGPIVIDLRGSRLVLGHGMTQRILVRKL